MATNLEKLRAKKAANQQKETELSTSFSVGEEPEPAEMENKHEELPVVETEKPERRTDNSNNIKDINTVETVKPIKTDKPIINQATAEEAVVTTDISPSKNFGIRLASEQDRRYLNMVPLGRGMTKRAFFIELMQTEFASVGEVDINDPIMESFRNSPLKTTPMTISVPEDLIEQIKINAARHMMKYQRYVAYVINKARINDSTWN